MLTSAQLTILDEVHSKLFKMFTYVTDQEQFKVADYWPEPKLIEDEIDHGKLVGDCDDFALACRYLLWKQNIPNRLIYCIDEDGDGHLVCEVEGYILDNRQTSVVTNSSLPYKWVHMSGFNIGDPWTEIVS